MTGHQLVCGAKDGSLQQVSYFLKKRINPDAFDDDGTTALYWASCRGHEKICRLLLANGAGVNFPVKKTGSTPLMACADNNQLSCMELLLRDGSVMVDQQNVRGDTALHMGAYRGHIKVVRLLIGFHANPLIRNENKITAVEEAKAQEETDCVTLLQNYIALYKQGLSSLQWASHQVYSKSTFTGSNLRVPSEGQWDLREEVKTAVNGSDSTENTLSITNPEGCTSFESTDSAINVSPHNSFLLSFPNAQSVSYTEMPYDLSLSSGYSLAYSDSFSRCKPYNHNTIGQDVSTESQNSHASLDLSAPHLVGPVSVDSQYQSFSLIPNISSESSRPNSSTTMKTENKLTNSLSKSESRGCDNIKAARIAQERSEYNGYRKNNLSFNSLTDNVKDTTSPLNQGFNNLSQQENVKSRDPFASSKTNHMSDNKGKSYKDLEVISGVKMSQFVESLQMQLLQNQAALRREQEANNDLQQQVNALKEENFKLKHTINKLFMAISERSSTLVKTGREASVDSYDRNAFD